jgi:2-oxoglutarate/2-oxoacid ferredoxin oxidoreductase subunit beta
MLDLIDQRWLAANDTPHQLEDYEGCTPRWCSGCGDHTILNAVLRLCRDEQLPPEKLVFVSGIGCSSRLPHYVRGYGFHSLHGRALPVAQGIKIRRPDLHIFVSTGDGDCCSIGTAHWIHAIRHNMDMTVLLHDNGIYGLTKMQMSPTSPKGLITNSSPRGVQLDPLNPLAVTLGVANVSFVAQVADWMPDLLREVLACAFHHRGLSFVRILQRCPNYLPSLFDASMKAPDSMLLLTHPTGIPLSSSLTKTCPNHTDHDPEDMNRARTLASDPALTPVGILYRNERVPSYETLRPRDFTPTPALIEQAVNREFDKFTVEPRPARTKMLTPTHSTPLDRSRNVGARRRPVPNESVP